MKKLLFWMVLIVGIVALIGSCAKKDDSVQQPPAQPLPAVARWLAAVVLQRQHLRTL